MNELSFIYIIEIIRYILLGTLWFILIFRFIKEESEIRKIKREIAEAERKKEE